MQGPLPTPVLYFVERTHSRVNLSFFALRRGAHFTLTLLLGIVLVACSADGDTSGGGGGGGTATVTDGAVEITADDLAFDLSTIEAPAGQGFTVTLTNAESQPHNFSVYTEEGGEAVVEGEIITGPDATTETVVEGLEPGEYYFQCDVHPDMNGVIVVEG